MLRQWARKWRMALRIVRDESPEETLARAALRGFFKTMVGFEDMHSSPERLRAMGAVKKILS